MWVGTIVPAPGLMSFLTFKCGPDPFMRPSQDRPPGGWLFRQPSLLSRAPDVSLGTPSP